VAKKWVIRQGTSVYKTIKVNRDLTGATVYFTVKPASDSDAQDTTAIIKKDITAHSNAANGESELVLTATDTQVQPGKYKADFKFKFSEGTTDQTPMFDVEVVDGITNRG
jgi:hypothetical protein